MLLTAASFDSVPKESVVADSDSDGQGRLAIVWTLGKLTGVNEDEHGTVFASEDERLNNVCWVGGNLLVWPVAGGTSLLASGHMTKGLPCSPHDVLVAEGFIYATMAKISS